MTALYTAPSPVGAQAHTGSPFKEKLPEVQLETTLTFHNRIGAGTSK